MFLLLGIAAGSACWPHVRPVSCCQAAMCSEGGQGATGTLAGLFGTFHT